jgi:hypothetical protein
MSARSRVSCPNCGGEMNHHADKVDFSASLEDGDAMDPDLGGVLAEFHTCAGCKLVVERPTPRG